MEQKNIDELMLNIDKKCKIPKYWNEFIRKQSKNQNIIIKDTKNKECFCTNCNTTFDGKRLKVGQFFKCPNCKTDLKIHGSNYNKESFEKSVILLQRMNKQIIARVFEIYSYFENNNKKIIRDVNEYVRIIPGVGTFLGNNVYMNVYGYMGVYNENADKWWKYNGYRCFTDFATYPYNKKKLIKGTKLEYAPLKEFREKFSQYNFLDTLQIAAHDSFEILWKMKLYHLSIDADKFNVEGSFYKRFKVPKSYLKFMQENDVSYRELRILQLLKNMELKDIIKYLQVYTYNYSTARFLYKHKILEEYTEKFGSLCRDMKILKKISEYVPLRKVVHYEQGMQKLHIYKDYLEMAKDLALNYKKKEDLFPENLIERHDELQKQFKIEADIRHCYGIYTRFLELSKYIYEDDKYIIFPANSSEEFVSEGNQQENCVNSRYSMPYINKETEIYFMRALNNINKSLVTIEFNENRVIQKEQKNHTNTTAEQDEFINKWVMYREFVNKREKHKNKHRDTVRYDLEKLVA